MVGATDRYTPPPKARKYPFGDTGDGDFIQLGGDFEGKGIRDDEAKVEKSDCEALQSGRDL